MNGLKSLVFLKQSELLLHTENEEIQGRDKDGRYRNVQDSGEQYSTGIGDRSIGAQTEGLDIGTKTGVLGR